MPAFTSVTRSIVKETPDSSIYDVSMSTDIRKYLFGYIIYFGVLFRAFIPSYELWINGFGDPSSIWIAVPALACALALHTIALAIVVAGSHTVHRPLAFSEDSSAKPLSNIVFGIYTNIAYIFHLSECDMWKSTL